MKRYRLYLNECYSGHQHVDHDGVVRFVDAKDVFEAMDKAYKMAQDVGAHSYRLMEGGNAEYMLTAAFASWHKN